jgi:hypothetical protein
MSSVSKDRKWRERLTRVAFLHYLRTSCRLLLPVQLPKCQSLTKQGGRGAKQKVDSTMIGEEER